MKTYEYKGYDKSGKACRGLVEAVSVKGARGHLAARGILAEAVSVTGKRERFDTDARTIIYRELGSMLGSGMSLVPALNVLIDSGDSGIPRGVLAGVRDRVKEGSSLASAFSECSDAVTDFEKAIIEVAERSGNVGEMLDLLAGFLESHQKLIERIQTALIYPGILITIGICMAIIMFVFLVPRARDMLEENGIPLPAITAGIIWLGDFVIRWGLAIAVVIAGIVWWFRRNLADNEDFALRFNAGLFRVPVLGRGLEILSNLRFARALAIMVKGGVPMPDSVELAGRATGSKWVASMASTEAAAVKHGSSLADAIRRIPPLSVSLPGAIETGEAGGSLARMLDNVSAKHERQWESFTSRFLAYLEPIIIVAIGGFVLLIALSVILPIISITKGIG